MSCNAAHIVAIVAAMMYMGIKYDYKKTNDLEYKETVSKSYLKTVSAFANVNDGRIIFGISDDGRVVGIKKSIEACLNIEN